MPKRYLDKDVLTAAQERISEVFDNFPRAYVSFSAGKDSTVMLHLVAAEARKRGRRIGLLLIDLEGQYDLTIRHALRCYAEYSDVIDPYWVCLPIDLRNAVSVYQPKWRCWDEDKRDIWIRQPPDIAITDNGYFPFFEPGMEFEEFVPEFGEWYSQGEPTACFVGIRSDESLNRYRTISSATKSMWKDRQWTSQVTDHCYNAYPIYDCSATTTGAKGSGSASRSPGPTTSTARTMKARREKWNVSDVALGYVQRTYEQLEIG